MNLSAFNVALQGLFPLTPIAAAVQGLIEQVQQDQKVNGSGGAKPAQARAVKDDLTVDEVVRQWELLEARLRSAAPAVEPEAPAPQEPEPRAKVDTVATPELDLPEAFRSKAVPPVSVVSLEAQMAEAIQIQRDRDQQQRMRRNDEEALLLVLAQL